MPTMAMGSTMSTIGTVGMAQDVYTQQCPESRMEVCEKTGRILRSQQRIMLEVAYEVFGNGMESDMSIAERGLTFSQLELLALILLEVEQVFTLAVSQRASRASHQGIHVI